MSQSGTHSRTFLASPKSSACLSLATAILIALRPLRSTSVNMSVQLTASIRKPLGNVYSVYPVIPAAFRLYVLWLLDSGIPITPFPNDWLGSSTASSARCIPVGRLAVRAYSWLSGLPICPLMPAALTLPDSKTNSHTNLPITIYPLGNKSQAFSRSYRNSFSSPQTIQNSSASKPLIYNAHNVTN